MTQHPPGYYAVAAAVYRLAGAGDWRYDRALLLLRALTALTVAAVLPVCCFAAARDLTGSEPVGVLAAFVPLLVPQLHFLGGTATNDGLTIATTAVVWALAVRVLCAGPTRRRLLLLALAMGAACWTKGTALTLLPVIVLAVALGYRRLRGPGSWVRPALGGVVGVGVLAGVLGGWWWVLNVIRYGGLQPSGFTPVEIPAGSFDPMGLPAYLWLFVARIRWTFFLEVGGRQPADLDGLTAVLAVAFTVLCVAGVVALRRAGDRAVLLLGIAGMTGLLFHTTYTAHLASGLLPGIQGRYLFVLLVPIAVLAAAGLAPARGGGPPGAALAAGGRCARRRRRRRPRSRARPADPLRGARRGLGGRRAPLPALGARAVLRRGRAGHDVAAGRPRADRRRGAAPLARGTRPGRTGGSGDPRHRLCVTCVTSRGPVVTDR
jgi:4-amino-4-deoxy-L-arabinose transferase-like glycosyltransferase